MHCRHIQPTRLIVGVILCVHLTTTAQPIADGNPLVLPSPGAYQLRILSSNLLELTRITTKPPSPARPVEWNFVDDEGREHLPNASEFVVLAGETNINVQKVGFKRRVIYAPLAPRDLRIGNHLYLQLTSAISGGQTVEVKNPSAKLWPGSLRFAATMNPLRYSPTIHVNQAGYVPAFPKKAMVGFFLGSLGEMNVSAETGFQLVDARTGGTVHQGKLSPRRA